MSATEPASQDTPTHRATLAWFTSAALAEVELQAIAFVPTTDSFTNQRLTFRDERGAWWRVDAVDNSIVWVTHAKEGWVVAPRPATLEGEYPHIVPVTPFAAIGLTVLDEEPPAGELGILDAFQHAVRLTRDYYVTSRLAMWDAEAALMDCYLRTDDGAVWTVGCLSGAWYRYEIGGWVPQPPPQQDRVLRDHAQARPDERSAQLLAVGPLVPEPITPAWDPPN